MLHVTNGDSTTATMERAGLAGDLLPWRDVLHEGPVPDLPPDELRRVRAEYLATLGAVEPAEVEAELLVRDERLRAARSTSLEPVVLWFEHDLYDQLQLIQILAGLPDLPTRVELICIGTFPGRPDFAGLGELEPERAREPVAGAHRGHARARPPRPRRVGRRCAATTRARSPAPPPRPTSACPTSRRRSSRLLEELPGTRDGLGRTERQLLEAVAAGARTPRGRVPREHGRGGGAVHGRHDRLRPARRASTGSCTTTARCSSPSDGEAVLAGEADRVELIGFDRWLGGLHVAPQGPLWRWDHARGLLSES